MNAGYAAARLSPEGQRRLIGVRDARGLIVSAVLTRELAAFPVAAASPGAGRRFAEGTSADVRG